MIIKNLKKILKPNFKNNLNNKNHFYNNLNKFDYLLNFI